IRKTSVWLLGAMLQWNNGPIAERIHWPTNRGMPDSMKSIHDSFAAGALPYWNRFLVGRAWLEDRTAGSLRFLLGPAGSESLSDVELNDHRLFAPGRWPWRPPLRMTVRARASHSA